MRLAAGVVSALPVLFAAACISDPTTETADPTDRAATSASSGPATSLSPRPSTGTESIPATQVPGTGQAPATPIDLTTHRLDGFHGQAGLYGELAVSSDDCLYVQGHNESKPINVVWPAGYTAARSAGTVTVFDGVGRPVARLGMQLLLGGGDYVPPNDPPPRLACRVPGGQVFHVDFELAPMESD